MKIKNGNEESEKEEFQWCRKSTRAVIYIKEIERKRVVK